MSLWCLIKKNKKKQKTKFIEKIYIYLYTTNAWLDDNTVIPHTTRNLRILNFSVGGGQLRSFFFIIIIRSHSNFSQDHGWSIGPAYKWNTTTHNTTIIITLKIYRKVYVRVVRVDKKHIRFRRCLSAFKVYGR